MESGTADYSVHGLRVRSEIPLPVPRAAGNGDVDLVIGWGPSVTVSDCPAPGVLVGAVEGDRRVWVTRDQDGYTVRCNLRCDFRLAADARSIEVRLDRDAESGIVADLILRVVLGVVLRLRGAFLLHASAVRVDGRTLAIAGHSGAGKSTLAALFCAEGAAIVSDDVLRVDLGASVAACYRGPVTLRLRPEARGIAGLLPAASSAAIEDGRIAVIVQAVREARLPLDALLLPTIFQNARAVCVKRLSPGDALFLLGRTGVPRRLTQMQLQRRFHHHTGLVKRVPVFGAELPVSLLADRRLAGRLARQLGPLESLR